MLDVLTPCHQPCHAALYAKGPPSSRAHLAWLLLAFCTIAFEILFRSSFVEAQDASSSRKGVVVALVESPSKSCVMIVTQQPSTTLRERQLAYAEIIRGGKVANTVSLEYPFTKSDEQLDFSIADDGNALLAFSAKKAFFVDLVARHVWQVSTDVSDRHHQFADSSGQPIVQYVPRSHCFLIGDNGFDNCTRQINCRFSGDGWKVERIAIWDSHAQEVCCIANSAIGDDKELSIIGFNWKNGRISSVRVVSNQATSAVRFSTILQSADPQRWVVIDRNAPRLYLMKSSSAAVIRSVDINGNIVGERTDILGNVLIVRSGLSVEYRRGDDLMRAAMLMPHPSIMADVMLMKPLECIWISDAEFMILHSDGNGQLDLSSFKITKDHVTSHVFPSWAMKTSNGVVPKVKFQLPKDLFE